MLNHGACTPLLFILPNNNSLLEPGTIQIKGTYKELCKTLNPLPQIMLLWGKGMKLGKEIL